MAEEDTFLGQGLPPAGTCGTRHSAIAGIHVPNVRHKMCVHLWPFVLSHFNHLLLNADFFFFLIGRTLASYFFSCFCRINSWTLLTVTVFLPFPVKRTQDSIHQLILDIHVHKTSNKKGLGLSCATAALLGKVKVGSKRRCSR